MPSAVDPADIAALTRALADAAHASHTVRLKLQTAPGPLAVLVWLRLQAIEDVIETQLEAAHRVAELALSVGKDTADG